ncbi:ribose 5-phosphate isomerase B [Thermotomaculum hydrothermale]|uniref:Ribose 5-phosphate isomerase B n=1 Tax=Thermotomaculum hydrothermale TaxID=981385 RepID=A0A7R6Q091_9BACT|nr:ribose 5-phosphate isomerase B [Thermotomaculum hydrothermale]BBB33103.1 ribose 5-phosphate isomerase B [Thermotomaculum hydrothermale]
MKIAIGSDHGGFKLKEVIKNYLIDKGYQVDDLGCYSEESVDYPDFAEKVAKAVAGGDFNLGVLMCGTGIGISIAANKVKGIRAALCHDGLTARLAKQHNNANIICMGGRTTGVETAKDIIDNFLSSEFEGGRHLRRINKIKDMENS